MFSKRGLPRTVIIENADDPQLVLIGKDGAVRALEAVEVVDQGLDGVRRDGRPLAQRGRQIFLKVDDL